MYRILEVSYLRDYAIWLRFSDGVAGEVDLAEELEGEVFEPLGDMEVFRLFVLHPELHTIVWPTGADLAAEFLHDRVKAAAKLKGSDQKSYCARHCARSRRTIWEIIRILRQLLRRLLLRIDPRKQIITLANPGSAGGLKEFDSSVF